MNVRLLLSSILLLIAAGTHAQPPQIARSVQNAIMLKVPAATDTALNLCHRKSQYVPAYIVRWTSEEFVSLIVYAALDSAHVLGELPEPLTFWQTDAGALVPVIESDSQDAGRLEAIRRLSLCGVSFSRSEIGSAAPSPADGEPLIIR